MCEVVWSIVYVLNMNSHCLLCTTVLQCRFSSCVFLIFLWLYSYCKPHCSVLIFSFAQIICITVLLRIVERKVIPVGSSWYLRDPKCFFQDQNLAIGTWRDNIELLMLVVMKSIMKGSSAQVVGLPGQMSCRITAVARLENCASKKERGILNVQCRSWNGIMYLTYLYNLSIKKVVKVFSSRGGQIRKRRWIKKSQKGSTKWKCTRPSHSFSL